MFYVLEIWELQLEAHKSACFGGYWSHQLSRKVLLFRHHLSKNIISGRSEESGVHYVQLEHPCKC